VQVEALPRIVSLLRISIQTMFMNPEKVKSLDCLRIYRHSDRQVDRRQTLRQQIMRRFIILLSPFLVASFLVDSNIILYTTFSDFLNACFYVEFRATAETHKKVQVKL
jgi:hypothetical protein